LIGDNLALDAALHGNDYLDGGSGTDKIWGDGGADHLAGGAGDDKLMGDSDSIALSYQGNDVLDGGDGNDELYGHGGNDTLIGGLGSDQLYGGLGDDTYQGVESGDVIGDIGGKNIIILADNAGLSISSATVPDGFAVMSFNEPQQVAGNAPVSAVWLADTQALRITLQNGNTLELRGGLYGMDAQLFFDQGSQSIDLEAWVSEHLHDDVTLSLSAISMDGQPATVAYSGTGADVLMGGDNNDTLRSYGGNDELQGNAGDDLLEGGSGDDILFGQDGVDTLQGGDGYDSLQGGIGDDSLDGGAGDDVLIGEEGADTLYGSLGADILSGMGGADVLYGGDGSDELQGGLDNDVLEGDVGDDNLFGQEGSDELHGGTGNDVLSGNAGDDVYLFNLGGGRDTIWEEGDSVGDVLRFGAGIAPEDISAAKSGYDLVLFHANGVDQVTISNWYVDPSWRLMQFEFSDGTTWSADDTGNRGLTSIRGTPGSDMLYGGALDETLSGFSGNDTLYGNAGNDTLIGGVGNDALYGGADANIYLFALGDGNDTIAPNSSYADTLYFSADIASTDIIVERMGNDLLLHHQNGLDSVKIAGWYSSYSQLKEVVFESDGTIWANSALNQLGVTHGNTYTLDLGDGAKNIADWGGSDSLTFGANIAEAEIVIARVGQDLKFAHVNGIDSIAIKDWFNNVSNQIETIRFSTTAAVLTAAQHTTPFLTLTGTAGNDVIQGGNAYGETLTGLGGNDTLNGGDGQDTYLFNQGDGQDTVTDTSLGGNALIFGPGLLNQLSISVNASNDTVYSFGTDKVTVKAGSLLQIKFVSNGTAAADLLNGGSYGDIIHGLASNDVIDGDAGGDDLYGDTGNDTIAGGDDSDWLYGGDGDDVLDGSKLTGIDEIETNFSDSIDYYVGGKGNDTLYGNSKDDYYYFDLGDGRDVIVEGAYYLGGYWYYGVDTLIFGAGITPDNIQVNKLNVDLVVTVSLTDSVTIKDWFTASGFKDRVEFFRFADGSNLSATDMTRLANTLRGTEGDDVLTIGSSSDGVLYGEGGNDTLNGGGGNDALHGGSGNDLLNGGAGNDEYYFARHDGQDAINDTGGIIDAVRFDASVSASEFVLSRSENDLVLTLTATNDKLIIKDYLNGNLSTYTVSGSNVVNYSNTALIESFVFADGGSLPSVASIQESLLNIRGTVSDDALNGTAWSNVMYGADGNDVMRGFEDEDVLYGGAGNDTLDGGSGDTNLLYGQDGDDVLIGEGGAGFGHGYLHGGTGNDTYVFKSKASFSVYDDAGADDQIMLDGNVGLSDLSFQKWTDELSISVIGGGTISIPNHFRSDIYQVERLVLADGTALGLRDVQFGTGNALTGTAEDSILIGSSANDTLNGGDGNDWLNGGLGSDAMTGGFGNDRYFVDSTKDTVTELSDQGIDTVYSSVTYTLESGVERLLLTGSTKINGTGNALDNNLTGGSGANTLAGDAGNDWLDGKGGIDKMSGGEGDDTFVVDNSAETVTERASEGIDLVLSSATFSLPNNVENLTLTGMLAIDATGNKLDNKLIGNDAANLLTGNAGNDTLDGMAGSDTLVGGKGGDIYRLGRDYGVEIAIENDSTGGVIDIAQFLPGIGADQLWFRHVGNNLEVSIIGTADKLIIKDWYLGSAYRVEQFKTAEGLTLQDSNVENLVAAMAGFAQPDFGQTTLPPAYEVGLDPVITAFWL
jgi:Ca2+-binding RTX toxin-like protein